MVSSKCLATFLVIWACPVILAHPNLYVRVQPQNPNKEANMVAQDMVMKDIEAPPDTHTNNTENYSKTTTVKEDLITPSGGKIDADTLVHRAYIKKQEEQVKHKDGATEKTADMDTDKYTLQRIHKEVDETNHKSLLDYDNTDRDCATESKHVIETDSGAVVTKKGERAVTAVKLMNWEAQAKGDNKMADASKNEGHITHTDQMKTSTVYVHDSDPNNLIIAGDQDIDTDTYTDDYIGTHQNTQQDISNGQLSKTSNVVLTRKENRVAHEHDTGAYHETPIHKFIMEDKEADDDLLGQYTLVANKQTEFKGKDGITEDVEENERKTINADRQEHTDDLTLKTISKAHPESPLVVKLSTKIIDRDHYTLDESASRKKETKLQNGGTRTVQENVERTKTYNMDTTPNKVNK